MSKISEVTQLTAIVIMATEDRVTIPIESSASIGLLRLFYRFYYLLKPDLLIKAVCMLINNEIMNSIFL